MLANTIERGPQLIFLAAVTPIVHDFYNYDLASPEYVHQFNQFLKVIGFFYLTLYSLNVSKCVLK